MKFLRGATAIAVGLVGGSALYLGLGVLRSALIATSMDNEVGGFVLAWPFMVIAITVSLWP